MRCLHIVAHCCLKPIPYLSFDFAGISQRSFAEPRLHAAKKKHPTWCVFLQTGYVLLIPRGEVPQSQLPDTGLPVRYPIDGTYDCIDSQCGFHHISTPLKGRYASRSRRCATDRVEAATDRPARRIVPDDNDYRGKNNYYLGHNTIRRAPSTTFSAVKHDTSALQIREVWESAGVLSTLKTRHSYARAAHPDSNTWFDIGGAKIEEDIETEKEVYHDIYVPHRFLPSTVEMGSAKNARARTHVHSQKDRHETGILHVCPSSKISASAQGNHSFGSDQTQPRFETYGGPVP
jgi:hypothetical protein